MPTDNRTWKPNGTTVIGTAPGREDVVFAPLVTPDSPAAVDELRAIAVLLAKALNADGLTDAQRRVLAAIRVYEAEHQGWPAPPKAIAVATGFTLQWVNQIFDQLEEMGLGERPPKGEVRRTRPFRTNREAAIAVPVGGGS
jgi:hypothetical protein